MAKGSSISSKKMIKKRATEFWNSESIWANLENIEQDNIKIRKFIEHEYDIIPEKERIGKGSVYIAYAVAAAGSSILTKRGGDYYAHIVKLFEYGNELNRKKDNISKQIHCINLAIAFMGEYASLSKSNAIKSLKKAKSWANHDDWKVREMSGRILRKCLKKFPKITLYAMKKWIQSDNENIRRIVTESARPLANIKWLRDPKKNDEVIEILDCLKSDSSSYVRKSVGNNLKDLSKYMPKKIIKLVKRWIDNAGIEVVDDLSSKNKSELGIDNYYLVWTIKHALRWLRKNNPEFKTQLQDILGENYVLYFDEKRNKLAIPK
ncbi:MAG: hypothetical protein GF364_10545 [Candidatus Lokiarchaeota archaeon]|nr:hypothetical protein [Candidatus Lokiarchaeota archaeon]